MCTVLCGACSFSNLKKLVVEEQITSKSASPVSIITSPVTTATSIIHNTSPAPTNTPQAKPAPTPTSQPTGVLFDYLYAVTLLEASQWKDAITAFALVIRRLPEYARPYHGRGLAYYHENQLELALQDFDMAIKLNSDLIQVYKDRGLLHRDLGRVQSAKRDFERALILYRNQNDLMKASEIEDILNRLAD